MAETARVEQLHKRALSLMAKERWPEAIKVLRHEFTVPKGLAIVLESRLVLFSNLTV
jgi:hypothetical protein